MPVPVLLGISKKSSKDTITDIMTPGIGPRSIAPTVITESFRSNVRNIALKWNTRHKMNAIAENRPIAVMLRIFVDL